jgi:hypothetical protein
MKDYITAKERISNPVIKRLLKDVCLIVMCVAMLTVCIYLLLGVNYV